MALFPKNIVFRNSGNSFNALKSYFAANPNEALLLGEIFVTYDPLNPDYASILTQDPKFEEPVSPFGNITQFARLGLPQRTLPYLSTLIYKQDRLREKLDTNGQSLDPPEYEAAGPGWDVTNPFPYDLTTSLLDELGDVATDPPEQVQETGGGTRDKQEGDTLTWKWIIGPEDTDTSSDWVGYFSIGPGFGNEAEGIISTASLEDTRSVTYPGGSENITDKSRLVWSQRDLQWKPKSVFPTLENRAEVDYGVDDEYLPEDGDGLVYDATDEKWRPGDPIEDGVVRIPDGRRGVDPSKEALVITGQETGWDPDSRSEYAYGETRWIAPLTDLDKMAPGYELSSQVSVKSKTNSPNDYWDRFEDGAFYLQQASPLSNYNRSPSHITPLDHANEFPEVDIKTIYDPGNASWSTAVVPTPAAGLGTRGRSYSGDFTFQFWAKWNDELFELDFEDGSIFSQPVRDGDTWDFLKCAGITFFHRYKREGSTDFRMETVCDFNAVGSDELVIIERTAPDQEFHICFVWNNTTGIYKVWVNGYLVGQSETQNVGVGVAFDPSDIQVGPDTRVPNTGRSCASMWIADIILSLVAEHSTELLPVLPASREFAPPGPWARKIVEGPKAALGTLGITRSGYFSWVAKDVPYKWNTGFAKDQRYWSEEKLDLDNRYLRGGGVLGWIDGQLGTLAASGSNDTNALYKPGDLKTDHEPWKWSSIFNAEQFPSGQDQATGSIGSSVLFLDGAGNAMRGTNWGWRYGTNSFGRFYRDNNLMLGKPLAPDTNFGGVRGVYSNPIEAGTNRSPWASSSGWLPYGEQNGEGMDALYKQQLDQGYNATAIKFFIYNKVDVSALIVNDSLSIRYEADTDKLRFYVDHVQNTGGNPDDFVSYCYTDGFGGSGLQWRSKAGLLKANDTNEIVIVQDFKNDQMYYYVNGELGEFYDVKVSNTTYLVPDLDGVGPEELDTDDPNVLEFLSVWQPWWSIDAYTAYTERFYRNEGLPNYVRISTGGDPRSGRPELIRYCEFTGGELMVNSVGVLQAFANRWDRDNDLNRNSTYSFSHWYDVAERHKGFSGFSGAGQGKIQPPQFFQSSEERTQSGARTSQVMGTYVGSSRSFYEIGPRFAPVGNFGSPDGEWHNQQYSSFIKFERNYSPFSNQVFKRSTTDYRESGAYTITYDRPFQYGDSDRTVDIYASGKQQDESRKYFVDVKTTSVQWEEGMVHTYRNGFWRGELIDSTSPYDLTTHEPVITPFADGDILYWSERLTGYTNGQPDSLVYYLENLDDVKVVDAKSNDQLFYDALEQEWVNKDVFYIERIESLQDVLIDPEERQDGSLLAWSESFKKYVDYYWTTVTQLSDLDDVAELNPQSDYYDWLGWNQANKNWEVQKSGEYSRNSSSWSLDGHWSTFMQPDWYLKRKIGKGIGMGDSTTPGRPFIEASADAYNTGRGDGGDFEYGDIDFGMPLGIVGGGNFETGEVDLPAEMRDGPDGGEFVKDSRRAMEVPTLRGYQFDPTELILDLSQPEPGLDRSLRVADSIDYQADTIGDCTINTFDDCFEYQTYYWTRAYQERIVQGWPEVEEYYGVPSAARYLMGSRLYLEGGEDWSVEFKARFDQPDTHAMHIFTQGNGGVNSSRRYCMNLYYMHYNHATMTPWEQSYYGTNGLNPQKDKMTFSWTDDENVTWRYIWEFESMPFQIGGDFRNLVLAFNAVEQQFSVFYDGARIATAFLEDFSQQFGNVRPKPTQMRFRDWQTKDYKREFFGFGCNPAQEGVGSYLQGAIKDIRIMQRETPYDASSTTVPAATTPDQWPLNPLPPAFVPNVPLADQQPLLVSLMEFRQPNDYGGTGSDGSEASRIGVDSVGRCWKPNPFSLAADEVTDPYNEAVAWPTMIEQTVGFQYDSIGNSKIRNARFDNGLSPYSNGWNGRCGLYTELTPELDLRDKTFTIDTVFKVDFNHWNELRVTKDTQLTEELVTHSTILLNCAAEEDLSDVNAGRSWALRVLDFKPSDSGQDSFRNRYGKFWENGIRFEWWRTDERDRVRYHYLDFWFGPDAFQSIKPERWIEYDRQWPVITDPLDYSHLVVERNMTEGSMTVNLNGMHQKKFHPMLKESFRDMNEFANPLMAIAMDANMNFDQGFDFSGTINYMRILTGTLPWGTGCQFPSAPPDLSAN